MSKKMPDLLHAWTFTDEYETRQVWGVSRPDKKFGIETTEYHRIGAPVWTVQEPHHDYPHHQEIKGTFVDKSAAIAKTVARLKDEYGVDDVQVEICRSGKIVHIYEPGVATDESYPISVIIEGVIQ